VPPAPARCSISCVLAWLRQPSSWAAIGAVVLGIAVAVYVVIVSGQRQLSQLEFALFQIIEVALTLVGAFFVGQRSASAAAGDVVRPHARSAFRRLTSLYEGLGRLSNSIAERREFIARVANRNRASVDIAHVESQLDILAVQVTAEIATANDAMEDWRDLVPDEVARLERFAESRSGGGQAPWTPPAATSFIPGLFGYGASSLGAATLGTLASIPSEDLSNPARPGTEGAKLDDAEESGA
jgi:hypothetical protein